MKNIKAVIFDMDGLLIDSEPLWRQAEIEIFNQVAVPLTEAMCHQTTGMRMSAATAYWFDRFPWNSKTIQQVTDEVINRVAELINSKLVLKPGALETVKRLKEKHLKLAICSSSPQKIIEVVAENMGIADQFDLLYSAEFETYGKPHPAAYITCAKKLSVAPKDCLVFEDSLTGALAGKSASMITVAIPEVHHQQSTKFDFCDYRFNALTEFDLI